MVATKECKKPIKLIKDLRNKYKCRIVKQMQKRIKQKSRYGVNYPKKIIILYNQDMILQLLTEIKVKLNIFKNK